jgi:Ino eighty subunit 1
LSLQIIPFTMAAAAPGRTSPAPATPTRRVVPIKRADGEPLTRADLQFDFLNAVFSDSNAVFTNPYAPPPKQDDGGGGGGGGEGENPAKITFAELYTNAIVHSSKATKVLKETMRESPAFAVDFSMLALLVNVGRVNTTMSCECVNLGWRGHILTKC